MDGGDDDEGGCWGKTCYASPGEAHRVKRHRETDKRPGRMSFPMNVYRCARCKAWHIGRRIFKRKRWC